MASNDRRGPAAGQSSCESPHCDTATLQAALHIPKAAPSILLSTALQSAAQFCRFRLCASLLAAAVAEIYELEISIRLTEQVGLLADMPAQKTQRPQLFALRLRPEEKGRGAGFVQEHLVKHQWYKCGKAPDYRFSLANERTFLAWIRTALALMAGAIGLHQFIDTLALFRDIVAALLSAAAGLCAVYAYFRWADNENAMRHGKDLRHTPFLLGVSLAALLLASVLVYWVLLR